MARIEARDGSAAMYVGYVDPEYVQGLRLLYALARRIPAPVLVDVGANVGGYAILAALVPGMTVHAFEPHPLALAGLREAIARNGLESRVTVYPCALLDREGTATLTSPRKIVELGLSTLAPIPLASDKFGRGSKTEVPVVRLDSFPFHRVDILKLDVEGAELMALRGGEATVKRHEPAILAEVQDKRTRPFGYDSIRITKLLEGWGYAARPVTVRDIFFWRRPEHDPRLWYSERTEKCLRFLQL